MEDSFLISGLMNGNKHSFEELFKKYYSPLVVFAMKMVKDDDLARELVQDVFVNFYEKRESIVIHTSLKAHLYQSVKNRCINYINRDKNLRQHHLIIEREGKENDLYIQNAMEESELDEKLMQVIHSLPEKCREVFEMSRFDGKSNQEIADALQISKRTVETQISKALKMLREKMSEYLWISAVCLIFMKILWDILV